MRLADKLLLCSAGLYAVKDAALTIAVINYNGFWRHNMFIWLFFLLAVVEYVKLLILLFKKWKEHRKAAGNGNSAGASDS